MSFYSSIRNSRTLRSPLILLVKNIFGLLKGGPAIFRRAIYDAMPIPFLVTGKDELFVVSTADKVIGREVFLHGEFDFYKLSIALKILEKEGIKTPDHLIDVGANIGTITIPAIKRGLIKTATAIEPHPANLRLLRTNLALNEIEQYVTVLPQAVGNKSNESLYLNESETNSGNHSIGTDGIKIFSTRLDDICFPDNSLLWMDIEGYEGHALEGAKRLLSTDIPVVCEFNPSFISNKGGMNQFYQAVKGKVIYDLQAPEKKYSNLAELINSLSARKTHAQWTDILVITRSA